MKADLEKGKFKKGDKITCLPRSEFHNTDYTKSEGGRGGSGYRGGRTYVIESISHNRERPLNTIYWPEDCGSGVYAYAIEAPRITNWKKHLEAKQ